MTSAENRKRKLFDIKNTAPVEKLLRITETTVNNYTTHFVTEEIEKKEMKLR